MANIGTFTKTEQGYQGEIATLGLQTKNVRIVAAAEGRSAAAPSHRIVVGHAEIGVAWQKHSSAGIDYLSVKLDEPGLKAPIYASLFDDDAGETANLVWTRPPSSDFASSRSNASSRPSANPITAEQRAARIQALGAENNHNTDAAAPSDHETEEEQLDRERGEEIDGLSLKTEQPTAGIDALSDQNNHEADTAAPSGREQGEDEVKRRRARSRKAKGAAIADATAESQASMRDADAIDQGAEAIPFD